MIVKNYFSQVLDGMAKGLFASLIIGTIIAQIGSLFDIEILKTIGLLAQYMMGPCIGVGIAYVRKSRQYTVFAAAVAGAIGAGTVALSPETSVYIIKIGEPAGALLASLVGVEIGRLVEGKTKFDLLLVPLFVILSGGIVGFYLSPILSAFMRQIGFFVNEITMLHPAPMGILLGIIVGIILTLPISSAALCIAINISGLAAGAACAGCCAQMVGFAVSSFRENKISGLISQGIGTSMIQMPNIIKNPWIWLPPTVAGGVAGLLSTTVFKMETSSVGAGMGTSGLVGQITTIDTMGTSAILPILIVHVLIPIIISISLNELLRKRNIIKLGDMGL
ncbi:MAG: PTS sugar transporter subunit IIC [Clostridiales bacterium]|jgi:uncharacterized membrane protein|nr:PTS sugar transporter subunit IIC [Clostridiales bacterium]